MSARTTTLSIEAIRRLSGATKLQAAGLVLGSIGMLVQIAAGSTMFPSLIGPTVLLAAAAVVVFVRGRWAAYVGLATALLLGMGLVVATVMTSAFVDQLTDIGRPGVVVGSLLHVAGLGVAVAAGFASVLGRGR